MNADIHLEHRAGSSQGKHEGEPSLGLCDRLDRTRDNSQRQLPTDRDYHAWFRPANIRLINRRSKLLRLLLALSSGKENATTKTSHRSRPVDTVTPYQANSLIQARWDIREHLRITPKTSH